MPLQDHNQNSANNSPEVHQELSKVAAMPKQNILILAVVCVIFGYLFFAFFINNKNTEPKNVQSKPIEVAKPAQNVVTEIPEIPQLPEPPKLVDPISTQAQLDNSPPPVKVDLPPPTPDNSASHNLTLPPSSIIDASLPSNTNDNENTLKKKEAKRRSSIILVSGHQNQKTDSQIEEEADFKKRGSMEMILGRGKVIEGVLESAIDSEFGGEVRALVSRDVFSESGKVILIPKGSRIFGTYSSNNETSYGRINVDWNRIDLTASGYTINIQSNSIDNLGRKGIQGRVDNKFKERLSNSLLTSAFNIAFANALDKIVAPPIRSQSTIANQAAAGQLNNIALAIYNDSTKDPATKIQLICSAIQNAIPDKTSNAYTTFVTACLTITTSASSTDPSQNLTSLMSSVNSAASTLLTSTDTQITPTQAQNASKQAFTDVTTTLKDMVQQQQLRPITTIPQGTPIKIYVNKDYKFPKAALSKVSIMQ